MSLHAHVRLDIVFISLILWNGVAKTMHLTGLLWHHIRESQGGHEGSWEIGRGTGAQLNGRQAFVIASTFGEEDDAAKMKVQALAEATQERLKGLFTSAECRAV